MRDRGERMPLTVEVQGAEPDYGMSACLREIIETGKRSVMGL